MRAKNRSLLFKPTSTEITVRRVYRDHAHNPVAVFEIRDSNGHIHTRSHRLSNVEAMLFKAERIISRRRATIRRIDKKIDKTDKKTERIDLLRQREVCRYHMQAAERAQMKLMEANERFYSLDRA